APARVAWVRETIDLPGVLLRVPVVRSAGTALPPGLRIALPALLAIPDDPPGIPLHETPSCRGPGTSLDARRADRVPLAAPAGPGGRMRVSRARRIVRMLHVRSHAPRAVKGSSLTKPRLRS